MGGDSTLAAAARGSLRTLFEAQKAEAWAEAWGALVTALAQPGPSALLPAAELIVSNLRNTLSTTPNAKKISQSLHQKLPDYAAALYNHPEARDILQPLTAELFLPIASLQTVEPIKALLAPLTGEPAQLALIPILFKTFIEATTKHRYTLYARADGPVDVVIADKTRAAVIPALAACVDLLNRVEDTALSKAGSSSSPPASGLALWSARHNLWDIFLNWGGYLESDERAGALIASEAKRASSALAVYGASEPLAMDEGLAGRILRTLDVLERLDHARTALDTNVVGWCLASPSRTHAAARTLLLSNLRFHQLTHTLGGFFTSVADAVRALFDPSLPSETLSPLYTLVATGPLSDTAFTNELGAACRSVNLGGRRGAQWANLIGDLAGRVALALSQEDVVGGKRKRPDQESVARLVAVLSRLIKIIVDAGARASAGDDEVEATIDAAAQAFGDAIPSCDQSAGKKRKSTGGRDEAADLIFSARLRVSRSARLIHRDYDVLPLDSLSALLGSEVLPELRLELYNYLYTHLALCSEDIKRGEIVDVLISTLGSGKRSWSGRDAGVTDKTLGSAAWTITAERGLAVFDVAATSAQLDTLAGIVIARAGGDMAGLTTASAIHRILGNAQTWELPAFRTALLQSLVSAEGKRGSFVVLSSCPAQWLSKNARTSLLGAAYTIDTTTDDETRGAIRSWLARLASAGIFGPLDAAQLKQLVKTGDNVPEPTLALVKAAYPTFYTSAIGDCKKPFASWSSGKRDLRSKAAAVLLDVLARHPIEAIKDQVEKLFSAAHANLAPAMEADTIDYELLSAWHALARLAAVLGKTIEDLGPRLLASATDPKRSVLVFDLIALSKPELLLPAYILLPQSQEVDDALRAHARKLSAEAYSEALSSLLPLLNTDAATSSAPALRATQILISSPVEGSGRAIASHINALLRALELAARVTNVNVLTAVLRVVTALVEDRTGLLRHGNVAIILSILTSVLLPSSSTSTCAPDILPLALSPLLSLTRHRPDLSLSNLPALVGVLATSIPLLQRARTTSSAAQKKAASRRPWWLSSEPNPDPASEHAALLSRILVSVCGAKISSTEGEGQKLSGPLAKHAPSILVSYARAASDPWAGLSQQVRKEIEPGLFALCEVVTAGGRADGRGREGEGVGAAFGLGDAHGDAEREVWADVWRAWSKKRYVGRG